MAFFGDSEIASESILKIPSKGNKVGSNEEFVSFCVPTDFKRIKTKAELTSGLCGFTVLCV